MAGSGSVTIECNCCKNDNQNAINVVLYGSGGDELVSQ